MENKIIKEFRENVWNKYDMGLEFRSSFREIIEDFLIKALASTRRDTLEELLKEGLGGGNWGRIILSKLSSPDLEKDK